MKLIHVTDLHLCPFGHKPVSRSEKYHEHIEAKWQAFCEAVATHAPDAILFSGDLLHYKQQSHYEPKDLNRITDMLERLKVPVASIPGNHDLPKSAFDRLNSTAYRQIVKAAKNVTSLANLADNGAIITDSMKIGNINIYGIPYLPLTKFREVAPQFSQLMPIDQINVVMVHVDAIPYPGALPLPFEVMHWDELSALFPHADVIAQGHIHESFPMAVRQTVTDRSQIISKPWSFMRNVNNLYVRTETLEARHMPSFTTLTFGERGLTSAAYEVIPHAPFAEAFNMKSLKKEIQTSKQISSMVEHLKQMTANNPNISAAHTPQQILLAMAAQQGLSQDIIDLTLHYLEQAGVRA